MKTKLIIASTILLTTVAYGYGADLSCLNTGSECEAITERAKGLVARKGMHALEIRCKNGTKTFSDKPTYDEQLAGIHWNFCGYDEERGLFLIGKQIDSLSTGILVDEISCKVKRAGQSVLISPDNTQYLAIEQMDGVDGETWTVFTIDGREVWSGYAGVTRLDKGAGYDYVYAQYENPRWKNNELTADFICSSSSVRGSVNLINPHGKFRWEPEYQCD